MGKGQSGMSGWSWLLVGTGGALGAAMRHAVGRWFAARGARQTAATLTVNMAGSFAAGVLLGMQLTDTHPEMYALLGTGLLGGLTTYSTLNAQKALLFGEKAGSRLSRYVIATYAGGWVLTALGIGLGQAAAMYV